MPMFTYDTGKVVDIEFDVDGSCAIDVIPDGGDIDDRYSVKYRADYSETNLLPELFDKIGKKVWLKYQMRRIWLDDGNLMLEKILVDIDEIGDILDTKSRYWEWSYATLAVALGAILSLVLALVGVNSSTPATAATKVDKKVYVVANADLAGNTEIVKMPLTGGRRVNLSNNSATDRSPALSPDGTRIAFVSDRDVGASNVWVMDSDGGNPRNLTYIPILGAVDSDHPAWSPDGSKIAFSSKRAGGFDIWVMRADGSDQTYVTLGNGVDDTEPTFSGDGSRVIFSSGGRLVSAKLDGSDLITLTEPGEAGAVADYAPATSPDGSRIVFWRDIYPGKPTLMVMNDDGSNLRQIPTGNGAARNPAWTPDGRQLVFTSDRDAGSQGSRYGIDLYRIDLATERVTRVTNRPAENVENPSVGMMSEVTGIEPAVVSYYFAEGTARPGFVQYFTIQNTKKADGVVALEFHASDDSGTPVDIPVHVLDVPAGSRITVNLNDYLSSVGVTGALNVSTKVTSSQEILVERPIYFSADPGLGVKVSGGSSAQGVRSPKTTWEFAEGTVRPGFVEFFTIQNPSDHVASVTLSFQASDDLGQRVNVRDHRIEVAPHSRATINLNDYLRSIGVTDPVNISTKITSNHPINAERPMYFAADPGLGEQVSGGS